MQRHHRIARLEWTRRSEAVRIFELWEGKKKYLLERILRWSRGGVWIARLWMKDAEQVASWHPRSIYLAGRHSRQSGYVEGRLARMVVLEGGRCRCNCRSNDDSESKLARRRVHPHTALCFGDNGERAINTSTNQRTNTTHTSRGTQAQESERKKQQKRVAGRLIQPADGRTLDGSARRSKAGWDEVQAQLWVVWCSSPQDPAALVQLTHKWEKACMQHKLAQNRPRPTRGAGLVTGRDSSRFGRRTHDQQSSISPLSAGLPVVLIKGSKSKRAAPKQGRRSWSSSSRGGSTGDGRGAAARNDVGKPAGREGEE